MAFLCQQDYFWCSGWVVVFASSRVSPFVGKRHEALAFKHYLPFKATFRYISQVTLIILFHRQSAPMADPPTVVGIVANIVDLVEFSTKVLARLNDFQSNLEEIPKAFRHIKAELPVLQETLKETIDKLGHGAIEDSTKAALLPAVQGCKIQIEALDGLLAETLPVAGDFRFKKTTKALWSITHDGKVESITITLRGYIATLTFYHAAASSTLHPLKGVHLWDKASLIANG